VANLEFPNLEMLSATERTTLMKTSFILCATIALTSFAMLGCDRRVDADRRDVGTAVVPDRDLEANRGVDADINVVGPRGGGVRVNVDEDRVPGGTGDVDVRVDTSRPLLRNDIEVRTDAPRGDVRVDVND